MRPVLDLAPGAEHNTLASSLLERVRHNVESDTSAASLFRSMRGSLAVVATDHAEAITLRFDHGRLTVHDGIVGIPDVSVRGSRSCIDALTKVPRIPGTLVPFPAREESGKTRLRDLAASMRRGDLVVYGLALHPRMVGRFLRLIADSN